MQKPSTDEYVSDDQVSGESNINKPTDSADADAEYHPVRRLLFFQLKLALDAIRDILLSPVSLVATILDLVQGRKGDNSYFEMLMKFGRHSETRINLFDQHQGEKQTVDNIFNQVEDVLKKQYEKGGISEKTKREIEVKFKKM